MINSVSSALQFELNCELERFRCFCDVESASGHFEVVGPDILKFSPRGVKSQLKIGFLALVHGNEVIGLPIVNTVIEALKSGAITTPHEIYFGLGNLPAAHAGTRFIEKDLNRCFGRRDTDTIEARRAREIEAHMLDHVDYLLDLHQTVHPNQHPFFIFQYSSPQCLQHMALMNTKYPTILQFDAIGDSCHLSTDEYLRSRGGFGVAFELGQLGFGADKFDVGVSTALKLIENTKCRRTFADDNAEPVSRRIEFPLYQITDRVQAAGDDTLLENHWINFSEVRAGDVLGQSSAGPLIAPQAGYVLFPKLRQTRSRGQDLMFLCSEIEIDDIKKPEMLPSPAEPALPQL